MSGKPRPVTLKSAREGTEGPLKNLRTPTVITRKKETEIKVRVGVRVRVRVRVMATFRVRVRDKSSGE